MAVQDYLVSLNQRFKYGISKEHAYIIDLENLFKELVKDVDMTNKSPNVNDYRYPYFLNKFYKNYTVFKNILN